MSFRKTSAFFITDKCLFGSYPTQIQIEELEEWGVDIIVNLTKQGEKKIEPYITSKKLIHFEISDNSVPESKKIPQFCSLIIYLVKMINSGKKIYIHCKGGHGRSGVLVACIFCYKYNMKVSQSLYMTNQCHLTRSVHARRPHMNNYWISKGSPQTETQKKFVIDMFWPYKINRSPVGDMQRFQEVGDRKKIDEILKTTNLRPIIGDDGNLITDIQKYRDSLIYNLFSW